MLASARRRPDWGGYYSSRIEAGDRKALLFSCPRRASALCCHVRLRSSLCEALAVTHALLHHEKDISNCDVICFIDNEAASTALIKGTSTSQDVDHLAAVAHIITCRANTRMWYEWVDSGSNISDGLSRDGTSDKLALEQNWLVNEHSDIGCEILNTPLVDFI